MFASYSSAFRLALNGEHFKTGAIGQGAIGRAFQTGGYATFF